MNRIRGRRPGGANTREAIMTEARRQFGDIGYRRTSLRHIAQAVGIDPRLILHYFGSKQHLFMESAELPFEAERALSYVLGTSDVGIGERLAEFIVTTLTDPEKQRTITSVARAAASEPEAAALVRKLWTDRLLAPLAQRLSRDHAELRASLVEAQIIGLVMGRYIVKLEPLCQAARAQLVRALAPVFDHYLTGDFASKQDEED